MTSGISWHDRMTLLVICGVTMKTMDENDFHLDPLPSSWHILPESSQICEDEVWGGGAGRGVASGGDSISQWYSLAINYTAGRV